MDNHDLEAQENDRQVPTVGQLIANLFEFTRKTWKIWVAVTFNVLLFGGSLAVGTMDPVRESPILNRTVWARDSSLASAVLALISHIMAAGFVVAYQIGDRNIVARFLRSDEAQWICLLLTVFSGISLFAGVGFLA